MQPETSESGGQLDLDGNVKLIPPPPPELEDGDDDEDLDAPHGRDVDGTPLAPYGLRVDGVPRKKPGRTAGGTNSRTSTRRKKRRRPSTSSPRPPRAAAAAAPSPKSTYTEGFRELLDLAGGMLDLASRAAAGHNPRTAAALVGDAEYLKLATPKLAPALGELAAEVPAIGALLDRVQGTGPYTKLMLALMPLGLQMAVNHGIMQPGALGTVPLEDLLLASDRYQATPPAQQGYAAA